MHHFLIPFISVALAELGDKTQLSVMLLASRTRQHIQLFWGVMLAFLIVDGAAILAGSWLTHRISPAALKVAAGILFLIFGWQMLKKKPEEGDDAKKISPGKTFSLGFLTIFLAEWGDKTQIASGVFAAQFEPKWVFIATMLALGLLTLLAIFIGQKLTDWISPEKLQKAAGILFIVLGVSFFGVLF